MEKLFSYLASSIYYLLFGTTLVVFHALQWLCFNLFGYNAHKKCVDALNFFLVGNTYVLGTRYKVIGLENIPDNVPCIIASNHQSFYDITSIAWVMRKTHPKYVSKQELGKGIPSISYNLNHGGSALIDRKNPKQSLTAIKQVAEYIEEHKRSVVIFPEGTRSKKGKPLSFQESGLKILCKYAPSAYMIPVTIDKSWRMHKWGAFPMGLGNKIKLTIHKPIILKDKPFAEIFKKTEYAVTSAIETIAK